MQTPVQVYQQQSEIGVVLGLVLISNLVALLSVSFQRKSHLPLNVEPEVSVEGIALQKNCMHGDTVLWGNLMPGNRTLENVVAGGTALQRD